MYLLMGAFDAAPLLLLTQKPGIIVGPISNVLGAILNFLFDFVYGITENASFGFTVILFTIVIKFILFPLAIKQQHSMSGMRKIQPEIKKIQDKYKGSKDPEIQQRMSMELSELYRKNKVNPASGCLPMLLQLPIIYALFYVIRAAYTFIDVLGNIYDQAANFIVQIPDYIYSLDTIAERVLPKGAYSIDPDTVKLILNKCSVADLNNILATAPVNIATELSVLFEQKKNIEYFFNINLLENPSYMFPAVIIPILAAVSTLTSSLLMNKQYEGQSMNDTMAAQQKAMTWVMPFITGFMAFTLPAGVGIYWITSSFFQTAQQAVLNKYFSKKDDDIKK